MKRFYTILALMTMIGCSKEQTNSEYLRWVGDSTFNPATDDQDFTLCGGEDKVKQYFHFNEGLQYKGEKKKLLQHFSQNYHPVESDQSGWINIRFIVNCKGKTGRFRIISSDEHYQEKKFDEKITHQLLELTKALDGWEILPPEGKANDYYQYLVFKIHNGNIVEIMP